MDRTPTTQMPALFLPGEELDLADRWNKKYAAALGQKTISIRGAIEKGTVDVEVLVATPRGDFYYPIHARAERTAATDRATALFLVDQVDMYLEEYFKDQETYLPIDWAAYTSRDGRDFWLKGQILNMEAERLADEILAKGERFQAH